MTDRNESIATPTAIPDRVGRRECTSIFGNPAVMVNAIGNEYRQLWQEWCARRSLPAIKTHE